MYRELAKIEPNERGGHRLPWMCRFFGHRCYCEAPRTIQEKGSPYRGMIIRYPTKWFPPSEIPRIWCDRCGKEWERE